jgi:hypothetical protein
MRADDWVAERLFVTVWVVRNRERLRGIHGVQGLPSNLFGAGLGGQLAKGGASTETESKQRRDGTP